MQARHADVVDALDTVTHDVGGDRRFLGHGQITRARRQDRDEAGPFRQRHFLVSHATRRFMMSDVLQLLAQSPGMLGLHARGEKPIVALADLKRDAGHLLRRFAFGVDDFGKTFAQRAMDIHAGVAQVHRRRSLERTQHFVARGITREKAVEQ